ncbi:hypothetical protein [Caballeronia sp. AZ10_KS36]|uniref:hypothetical protein n=1 Tax=Caballeronia sp. AZ10_KS36 TaxID=2921757 RepID=UPI0020287B2F|nr:hypothetical protein [Caballeronia sp. AZ10_KS36]
MINGGNPNINNAPVSHMAPVFDHLNTVDAMKAALAHPAFEAKYGDLLRAKHPVLARASENAKASDRLNGRVNGRGAEAMDGNFMPKGWDQTPFDDSTLAVARGEEQRNTDPRTVAGLDTLGREEAMNENAGGKGVNSRAFQEGQTQKPRDISPLIVDLAKATARLTAAIARKGGIPRLKPTVTGRQGVKGLRGADAAEKRRIEDAATHERKRLKAAMDAAEAQAAETGAEMAPIPTRWDARLGQYVLAK